MDAQGDTTQGDTTQGDTTQWDTTQGDTTQGDTTQGDTTAVAHLLAGLQHVVSVPPGDGHEGHGGGVVADLLDVLADLLGDLLEAGLAVGGLGGVHLVDPNDELLDPQGEGQQGVLPGLAVL